MCIKSGSLQAHFLRSLSWNGTTASCVSQVFLGKTVWGAVAVQIPETKMRGGNEDILTTEKISIIIIIIIIVKFRLAKITFQVRVGIWLYKRTEKETGIKQSSLPEK